MLNLCGPDWTFAGFADVIFFFLFCVWGANRQRGIFRVQSYTRKAGENVRIAINFPGNNQRDFLVSFSSPPVIAGHASADLFGREKNEPGN